MNKQIHQLLPELTTPQSGDFLPIESSGVTRRVQVSNLVTKQAAGLGNVDNTSDANKPVSTATQLAIDAAADDAIAIAVALGGA